jgi:hypothetical protein
MKNQKTSILLPVAILFSAVLSTQAFAQQDPGHPRVNEIQGRIDNQEKRIDQGINKGQLSPGQAARDIRRDARVERQLKRDEAAHGGHITKGEQAKLNRELDRNSRKIHDQRTK